MGAFFSKIDRFNFFKPKVIRQIKVTAEKPLAAIIKEQKKFTHIDYSHFPRAIKTKAFDALISFDAPYIKNAKENLSKLMGFENLSQLKAADDMNKMRISLGFRSLNKDLSSAVSDEYALEPHNFFEIHSALTYKFGEDLSGLKILEMGCVHAPYLYFLQKTTSADVTGLEINEYASRYAKENGLNIMNGDSSSIPFKNDTFDVVLTRHFLEYGYIDQFNKDRSQSDFVFRTVEEALRVLKPGGHYISFNEDAVNDETLNKHGFSKGEKLEINTLEIPVYLFTK